MPQIGEMRRTKDGKSVGKWDGTGWVDVTGSADQTSTLDQPHVRQPQPINPNEPDTWLGGALKGLINHPGGIGVLEGLLSAPSNMLNNAAAGIKQSQDRMNGQMFPGQHGPGIVQTIKDALATAKSDPEAFGRDVGNTTGQTMIGAGLGAMPVGELAAAGVRGTGALTSKIGELAQTGKLSPVPFRRSMPPLVRTASEMLVEKPVGRVLEAAGNRMQQVGRGGPTIMPVNPAETKLINETQRGIASAQPIGGPAEVAPAGAAATPAPPTPNLSPADIALLRKRYPGMPDAFLLKIAQAANGPAVSAGSPASPATPTTSVATAPATTPPPPAGPPVFSSFNPARSATPAPTLPEIPHPSEGPTVSSFAPHQATGATPFAPHLDPAIVEGLQQLGYPPEIIERANPAAAQLVQKGIRWKPEYAQTTDVKPVSGGSGTPSTPISSLDLNSLKQQFPQIDEATLAKFASMMGDTGPMRVDQLGPVAKARLFDGMDSPGRAALHRTIGGLDAEAGKLAAGEPSWLGQNPRYVPRENGTMGRTMSVQSDASVARSADMVKAIMESPLSPRIKQALLSSIGAGALAAGLTSPQQ